MFIYYKIFEAPVCFGDWKRRVRTFSGTKALLWEVLETYVTWEGGLGKHPKLGPRILKILSDKDL